MYTVHMEPTRILFVCMANIVRSPMAENLFRHIISQRNIEHRFLVDSAGTAPGFSGRTPHPTMTRIAARSGVANTGISRTIESADLDRFDMILVMDSTNHADVSGMAVDDQQRERIYYLGEFHPHADSSFDIDDPIMGTTADFEDTYILIEECVIGLINHLQQHPHQ